MGKQGPCCHCGVTSTPLWRNGPPEKPVLCNACGSRWRTKGSLVNYTPLHSRAETDDVDDHRVSKFKRVSIKQKETYYPVKRKYEHSDMADYRVFPPEYGLFKGFDEDNSNRSSSGSAISNSESCAQYGSADASDLTGPSQPVWGNRMPSRKRTCVTRPKQSPVEKLTKDLYTIWHEQQSSCMSGYSEEDVLLETDKPMVSVEIGHGSMLIRHPSSIAREEESEASSLPIDHKKQIANSVPLMTFSGITEDQGVNSSIRETGNSNSSIRGTVKINKPPNHGPEQERIQRDKDEKLQILAHHNSPLCHIDMQDILNYDEFASLLENNEQQQLLKFLSSVDTVEASASLKSMFTSPQFKENLLSFQKLLAEGVFDSSLSGVSIEDSKALKKLIFGSMKKSKWVEQYKTFKDAKGKDKINGPEVAVVFNVHAIDHSATKERSQDGPHHKLPGAKVRMKSPTRIVMKPNYDKKEQIDTDETFFDAKRVFLSENDNGSSIMVNSSHFTENSEQDLLLDLPTNGLFPQAELLLPTFVAQASTSSSSVHPNGVHI